MKKIPIIVLCLLLILSFVGCGGKRASEAKVKTFNKNGIEYTIDKEKCTIQNNQHIYSYVIGASGTTITYPNGQFFTWKELNGAGTGAYSSDFDDYKYDDPLILIDVIDEASNTNGKSNHENAGIGVLLLLIGIVGAVWPDKIWFLNWGWRYKNAEPSDLALGLYRVGGIIVAFIGLILIIT